MDLNYSSGAVIPHGDKRPEVAGSAFVAPGAFVIGAVSLGEESSVWYGAVVHADPGYPASIGEGCVVGHKAVIHGCEIEGGSLIGMNATVLNGAKIGEGSIVAAGAVITEGHEFPARSLIVGAPARQAGEVTDEQARDIARGARSYIERATAHREALRHNS